MTHQQQIAFENIVGKEEIARNEQFLLFPQCFLLDQIIVSPSVHIFDISLFTAELEEPKLGISGNGLNAQCRADFYQLWERSILKTMWENEKMLVTSIFSLFHNVFSVFILAALEKSSSNAKCFVWVRTNPLPNDKF